MNKPFAKIALPVGLRSTFTYSVPAELRPRLAVGMRVKVPFGPRTVFGYVVEFTDTPPPKKAKAILTPEPDEVLFTPEILRLTKWVSDYYLAPWGQVLEAALPASVRHSAKRKRGAADAEVMSADEESALEPLVLEPEQVAAVETIARAAAAPRFASFLLYGVTGSGKTEVYLDAAENVIRAGGNVLLLVPEIAMGTQILNRVRRRFGVQVGFFHSLSGEANRRRVWNEARRGDLPLVVGTRSAVFVPFPNLRLVLIDEEQEGAYKQEETPRYHGRDVAIMRARQAHAVVVLGSATPSLESLYNVNQGKYQLLRLNRRVDDRPPARVVLVDLNEGRAPAGPGRAPSGPRPVLTPILIRSVQDRLDRGEQTILFLNRRGHSPFVQCADCGAAVQCTQCDVIMTFHKSDRILRCHYCNAVRRDIESCPACRGSHLFFGGVGTQKVEELLREIFPQARLFRMDLDATRKKGTHGDLIEAMERGEIDILLGTQMVAKGFHFPRVTLVGVIQADHEMLQPDFRASERAFQILTQVAGRAGRGGLKGEVVFQSLMPWHHVITCAASEDYFGFAEQELKARGVLQYPPFHRLIDLLFDGVDEEKVKTRAEKTKDLIHEFRHATLNVPGAAAKRGFEMLGPAPMPHARLKGRYRWHLILKGPNSEAMHEAVLEVLGLKAPRGLSNVRLLVDVDPMQMG